MRVFVGSVFGHFESTLDCVLDFEFHILPLGFMVGFCVVLNFLARMLDNKPFSEPCLTSGVYWSDVSTVRFRLEIGLDLLGYLVAFFLGRDADDFRTEAATASVVISSAIGECKHDDQQPHKLFLVRESELFERWAHVNVRIKFLPCVIRIKRLVRLGEPGGLPVEHCLNLVLNVSVAVMVG